MVITKKARENLVKARAGAITLPKIIGIGHFFGLSDTKCSISDRLSDTN